MGHLVRRRLAAVSPSVFLRAARGRPRGFWASGERWVAHAGVHEDVAPDSAAGTGTTAPPIERFQEVQERARRTFARSWEGSGSDAPPRVFGGFSFAGRGSAERAWAPFGSARFHLPQAEIEFGPDPASSWLTVRADGRRRAEALCERWLRVLTADGAPALRGPPVGRGSPVEPDGFRRPGRISGIDRRAWERMVKRVLRRIKAGEADKVVLARTLDVEPDGPVEPDELVAALWRENRGSHVFLFEPAAGHALVGAAPETVAVFANGVFRATAVAGSAGVGTNSVETAYLADRLFNSAKDRAEHDFVVRDMVARLEALDCEVSRDVEPHVLALARIQHLETKIAAKLPPGLALLDVLASLHPTPAVCGSPREVALSVLSGSEVFDRGWYAGPVGWLDSAGKGIFVPALRSAVCFDGRWRLFAGAGIVAGSDPVLEWEETEIKFQPVLRAMVRAEASERAERDWGRRPSGDELSTATSSG